MLEKETEYNHIDKIGSSFKNWHTQTEKILLEYYYKSELKTIKNFLFNYNFKNLMDLGCGEGSWYSSYKKIGFKRIIGIDISKERLEKAKELGYDEVYCQNAYELPLEDNSQDCIISNNMILHVLQDEDKIKIFQEIKRVLSNNGIFIFNFPPKKSRKSSEQTYFQTIEISKISELIKKSGLTIKKIEPSYFLFPLKGAHPRLAKISTSIIYPITDTFLKKFGNIEKAKEVYVLVKK